MDMQIQGFILNFVSEVITAYPDQRKIYMKVIKVCKCVGWERLESMVVRLTILFGKKLIFFLHKFVNIDSSKP